jgi:hypothetical protein
MDKDGEVELDPILSPRQMYTEAGIGKRTWYRFWRPRLPMTKVSPGRNGCRQSIWRRALAEQTEGA